MMRDDPFKKYPIIAFYHFTDRRNLPNIRKHGGLYSWIKLRKKGIDVPNPGGNEWSHEADVNKHVDIYVHLCFRSNHPMEYLARQKGHIGDTIFLQVHPNVLTMPDVKFAPGVSNKTDVKLYTIEEAKDIIDFEVLYTPTDWSDPKIQQRLQQAEKSEILIPDHIPISLIRNLPNG